MEYLLDRKDSIQSNKVCQGQRTHWEIATQLKGLIDVLNSANTLIESLNSLLKAPEQSLNTRLMAS